MHWELDSVAKTIKRSFSVTEQIIKTPELSLDTVFILVWWNSIHGGIFHIGIGFDDKNNQAILFSGRQIIKIPKLCLDAVFVPV